MRKDTLIFARKDDLDDYLLIKYVKNQINKSVMTYTKLIPVNTFLMILANAVL